MENYSKVNGPYLNVGQADRVLGLNPKGKPDEKDRRRGRREHRKEDSKSTTEREIRKKDKFTLPMTSPNAPEEQREIAEKEETIGYGKSKFIRALKRRIDVVI